jgi:hypothetical protein
MSALSPTLNPERSQSASAGRVLLRLTVVALTLATAAIHASLGGLLFYANAAGYTTLAVAMALPIGPIGRLRWLVRLALLGFTIATIGGWVAFGARFPLAYADKGIEALLVGCLVREIYVDDGGFGRILRRLGGMAAAVIASIGRRPTQAGA